jgi:methionyl-tRNA formyltransferase
MRVVFFGTPAFAVPTLEALLASGHDVVGVVAQPDRPSGRGQQLTAPPTAQLARASGVPLFQPTKLRSGPFPDEIAALRPDVAVVVAYGRILPPALLAIPARGCINVHASLLPRWRGAAPIQWSVLEGDVETGVCTMQMAEGLDTGDLLLVERTPIGPDETAGELFERLAPLGAALLVRTLERLDTLTPRPQPKAGVTYASMLTREMGRIDWCLPAATVHNRVRGLSPWPGTTFSVGDQTVKLLTTRRCEGEGAPGERLGGARVACGEGAIELVAVQAAGRRPVTGLEFFNTARLSVGDRVG